MKKGVSKHVKMNERSLGWHGGLVVVTVAVHLQCPGLIPTSVILHLLLELSGFSPTGQGH